MGKSDLFSMSFAGEQREQLFAALAFSFAASSRELKEFYALFGPFQMFDDRVETKKNKVWLHSLVFDGTTWWLRSDDGGLTTFDLVHPSVRKTAAAATVIVQDFLETVCRVV